MNQTDTDNAQSRLLETIEQLVLEVHPDLQQANVHLESHLETDLGLDSLARTELLLRLTAAFDIQISEEDALTIETPLGLLKVIEAHRPASIATHAVPAQEPIAARDAFAGLPDKADTLVKALQWHGTHHAERTCILLYESSADPREIRYRELLEQAHCVAGGLRALGVTPGKTVAIMLPTGAGFFFSFYGALLAGAIPVPLYPPARSNQINEHLQRHANILANAGAVTLVTTEEIRDAGKQMPELPPFCSVESLLQHESVEAVSCNASDLALIQYTSGSTGQPKGVALTHANLLANVRAMGRAAAVTPDDVFVSWLPLYHDMGLIGACLGAVYHAIPLVLMAPAAFIVQPKRWLWAIHRHRGTLSAAPNFAYDLCAEKIRDVDCEGLDLSSWRLAFNGAEPVHAETLQKFSKRFAPCGFSPAAMTPVYGLAENAVGLAFPPLGRGPRVHMVLRDPLQKSGQIHFSHANDSKAIKVVSCGRALPGHEIRIADDAGQALEEGRLGRIQFRGPSSTQGYYRNPEATRELIHDGWLNSGDRGFIMDREVFVTARDKDIIIRAGRNIYPYEMEQAVGELAGIRKHAVAVFALSDDRARERLAVVAETRVRDKQQRAELHAKIQSLAMLHLEIPADEILLVAPRTVPKTSSGKIRRGACREQCFGGADAPLPASGLARLRQLITGFGKRISFNLKTLARFIYGLWVWSLLAILGGITWLLIMLLPFPRTCRRIAHWTARGFLLAIGIPLKVRGREHLPTGGNFILAANHASYIDGVVLTAAINRDFGFVAKQELTGSFLTRLLLRRLGTEFVERFERGQRARDSHRLTRRVGAGRSLIYFPEGTFTVASGLRPFRMGAFVAAVRTDTPVVPVSLAGTRRFLPAESWWPVHGPVTVTIRPALTPAGSGWKDALALRQACRQAVLEYCGEADLKPHAIV